MTLSANLHTNFFYPPRALLAAKVCGDSPSHYFFTAGSIPAIDGNYANFYRHYIEVGSYQHLASSLDYIHHENPDLSLCLSTKTAFVQPTSELFMQMLQKQFWITDTLYDAMKTCLQESILNAVIHGNLNIHHSNNVLDHFEQYYADILKALECPEKADKYISIFAWRRDDSFILAVCDKGKGFTLKSPMPIDNAMPHGRGFVLIQHFAHQVWQATPNNLFMEFKHDLHPV